MSIKWISAEPARGATITIDSARRITISAGATEVLNVSKDGQFALYVGYDSVNKRIALAKPDVVRQAELRPYNFDRRRYAYAKKLTQEIGIADADLPLRYEYIGRDYSGDPKGVHSFGLVGHTAPDEAGSI
ncbi:hypothetical protein [Geomicrobium sp. JCM 19037]|uniref:hypothetical protein n=1 Tax=Geomicrobium sp. JCM 19037 TaxID=1460634 RepID=UPI0005A95C5F|nr:hypothetical protein [Geomicrobium sp. JCM 19037]